jgi:hypothetical protein
MPNGIAIINYGEHGVRGAWREFFIQMWLQNPALAKQGGIKVQNLLSPLRPPTR